MGKDSIEYLDDNGISKDSLILVAYHQFPFMIYTEYDIELIWPLRQEYIENSERQMYIVYNDKSFWPNIFIRGKHFDSESQYNFSNKIKDCILVDLSEYTHIYDCPPIK